MPDTRPTVALVAMTLGRRRGPSASLAELVTTTSERFRFVVLATQVPSHLQDWLEWQRIPAAPGHPRLRWAHFALRASLLLRALKPDLVHVWGANPMIATRVDLATVIFHWADYDRSLRARGEAHDSIVERIGRRGMVALERLCYRPGRVRMLATVSEGARGELASAVPGVPAVLTREGVDCARFRPDPAVRVMVRARLRVSGEDVVAVFVGLERWNTKGLSLAIKAFARALRAGAGPTRLWVLGSAGQRWRRLVAHLRLEASVRLLGFRPDVERYLAAADIFVLPTVYEASCRAAHEAAAAGLPIVAPAVHGVTELVGQNEAGLIVTRDVDAIARALSRLAGDAALRRRLGDEGRRRAKAIGRGDFAESVAALYERLLAQDARA